MEVLVVKCVVLFGRDKWWDMKWGYVWAVVDCYVFMLDNVGILCYS